MPFDFFFCGRGLKPKPFIFYALSISTELSLQGHMPFFFGSSSLVAGAPQLNVEKWDVRGSNPGPCINYAISLPTELSSQGHDTRAI